MKGKSSLEMEMLPQVPQELEAELLVLETRLCDLSCAMPRPPLCSPAGLN